MGPCAWRTSQRTKVKIDPDCDFEDGFCGWKEEHANASIKWEIKHGSNYVSKLRNLHDHTCKNETGLFAYMRSISSQDSSGRNMSAQLVTMIQRSNIPRCLHLWNSASDPSFGLLTLSVIGCENASERCIIKQVRDFTKEWNHISLDVRLKDYKLIVEGTITSEDEGYLAIDDISLKKGYCLDCTFEDGFCNWKNEDNSWKRITDDSQRYILITGENKNTSTKAKLIGPEVDTGDKSSCLTFSYNMSGDENIVLSVLLSLNKTLSTLGTLRGNDSNGWRNLFFEIETNGEKYKLQVLAIVTTGYIGLDNISLIFEPCPGDTTTIATPPILSTNLDSIITVGTWANQEEKSSNEGEKDNKTTGVLVGVAVGVGVLGLAVLIAIGIYTRRRRRLISSSATTSIQTDHKMAMNVEIRPGPEGNEVYIDTKEEYANFMAGKIEYLSPGPTFGNNQAVQSTRQASLIKDDCEYSVISIPKRNITQGTQEEQTYDHLDMGEKVPNFDDDTYDHVKH
ncbi:hypothetical protein CHS0354_029493 [Potamilus streckersoni]|uniref:MAM domain-containing protein n=1 Tax=Potamilus streckersoni TaxID=2493646 RepID=A0AAE0S7H6_9BIVA|nr:hypothetical protein CHS0354_029493 [Potamilus streckersoni]